MSVFHAYNDEFGQSLSTINSRICLSRSSSDGDKSSYIEKTQIIISQAKELLKQMNVEVITCADKDARTIMSVTLKENTSALRKASEEFERLKESLERSSLIGEKSALDRGRVLTTTAKLDRQNQMILQAQQSVAETEVVAESIVTNLESNREKIATVEGRVDDLQGIADSARRMVTSMSRRWWA